MCFLGSWAPCVSLVHQGCYYNDCIFFTVCFVSSWAPVFPGCAEVVITIIAFFTFLHCVFLEFLASLCFLGAPRLLLQFLHFYFSSLCVALVPGLTVFPGCAAVVSTTIVFFFTFLHGVFPGFLGSLCFLGAPRLLLQ